MNEVLGRMGPVERTLLDTVILSLSSRLGAPVELVATAKDAVEVRIGNYEPVEIGGNPEGWTSEDDWLIYYYLLGVDQGLEMAGR